MSLPSAVHVPSIIKRGASGDWEMCICILYSLFLLLFVFCFVLYSKKEGAETRILITERAGWTISVSYLCFPLISDVR